MHEILASDSKSITDDLELSLRLRLRLRNDMKKEEIE